MTRLLLTRTQFINGARIGVILMSLGLMFAYLSLVRVTQNFDVVEDGELYRSAQLLPWELDELIRRHGIRSVVSLRGNKSGSWWLDPQLAVMAQHDVQFDNVDFKTTELPPAEKLQRLKAAFDRLPRPILIHCRSGSDRTGMAAAFYQMLWKGRSKDLALEQLEWNHWHIPAFAPDMRRFIQSL